MINNMESNDTELNDLLKIQTNSQVFKNDQNSVKNPFSENIETVKQDETCNNDNLIELKIACKVDTDLNNKKKIAENVTNNDIENFTNPEAWVQINESSVSPDENVDFSTNQVIYGEKILNISKSCDKEYTDTNVSECDSSIDERVKETEVVDLPIKDASDNKVELESEIVDDLNDTKESFEIIHDNDTNQNVENLSEMAQTIEKCNGIVETNSNITAESQNIDLINLSKLTDISDIENDDRIIVNNLVSSSEIQQINGDVAVDVPKEIILEKVETIENVKKKSVECKKESINKQEKTEIEHENVIALELNKLNINDSELIKEWDTDLKKSEINPQNGHIFDVSDTILTPEIEKNGNGSMNLEITESVNVETATQDCEIIKKKRKTKLHEKLKVEPKRLNPKSDKSSIKLRKSKLPKSIKDNTTIPKASRSSKPIQNKDLKLAHPDKSSIKRRALDEKNNINVKSVKKLNVSKVRSDVRSVHSNISHVAVLKKNISGTLKNTTAHRNSLSGLSNDDRLKKKMTIEQNCKKERLKKIEENNEKRKTSALVRKEMLDKKVSKSRESTYRRSIVVAENKEKIDKKTLNKSVPTEIEEKEKKIKTFPKYTRIIKRTVVNKTENNKIANSSLKNHKKRINDVEIKNLKEIEEKREKIKKKQEMAEINLENIRKEKEILREKKMKQQRQRLEKVKKKSKTLVKAPRKPLEMRKRVSIHDLSNSTNEQSSVLNAKVSKLSKKKLEKIESNSICENESEKNVIIETKSIQDMGTIEDKENFESTLINIDNEEKLSLRMDALKDKYDSNNEIEIDKKTIESYTDSFQSESNLRNSFMSHELQKLLQKKKSIVSSSSINQTEDDNSDYLDKQNMTEECVRESVKIEPQCDSIN
ncbi:hypothetical protein A3Q56_02086 [Intoshia linei]|uniref:Uncharacterized protein n=1 Tax=Intoshia linei TaxID=1819745 RepID=A0A177B9E0_9BILA|nr:hypothetical protein A3Q56_02086 [Intoshia linei]